MDPLTDADVRVTYIGVCDVSPIFFPFSLLDLVSPGYCRDANTRDNRVLREAVMGGLLPRYVWPGSPCLTD